MVKVGILMPNLMFEVPEALQALTLPLTLTIVSPEANCPSCGFRGPLGNDQTDPHSPDLFVECPECGAPLFAIRRKPAGG